MFLMQEQKNTSFYAEKSGQPVFNLGFHIYTREYGCCKLQCKTRIKLKAVWISKMHWHFEEVEILPALRHRIRRKGCDKTSDLVWSH